MPTIVFLINEDWFFVSHFRHLARSAISAGFGTIILTGGGRCHEMLTQDGIKVVFLPTTRRGLKTKGVVSAVSIVETVLAESPHAILHGFGLFAVLIGTLAGRKFPRTKSIYTITGRGYAGASKGWRMKVFSVLSWLFCRYVADSRTTRWIVENEEDIARSGLNRANKQGRVAVVRGAGVDPDQFSATEMPNHSPLRVAFVARLIWSKGLDIAVGAVSLARQRGLDVTLTIAGDLDTGNPRSVAKEELKRFAEKPGIHFVGHIDDIPSLWSQHHLAILPSRGGEGVPKSLIEAASCARPILTTNVPGCNELARSTQGWIIPVDDTEAAANALWEIASAPQQLQARGHAARSAVIESYSERMVWTAVEKLYRDLGGRG